MPGRKASESLRSMFGEFQAFIEGRIVKSRPHGCAASAPDLKRDRSRIRGGSSLSLSPLPPRRPMPLLAFLFAVEPPDPIPFHEKDWNREARTVNSRVKSL